MSRYVRQFREIFTEEGRRQVKITHQVPGRAPVVTYTQVCNTAALTTTKSAASSSAGQPITSTAKVLTCTHLCTHVYTPSSLATQPVTSTAKVFTSSYTCVMLHHHHHHQLSLFLCSVNTYSVASLSGLKTNFTSRVLSVFLAPHCLHLATFEM